MSANKSTQLVDNNSIVAGSQTQHDKTNIVTDSTDTVDVKEVECNKDVADNNTTPSTIDSTTNMPNIVPQSGSRMTIPESSSDFKDWLEGIKMVARLPGGMPVEFRRKLWLALAERYLKRRGIDWEIEKIKWFSDKCRADDEELGIQIVKDLHRTGHSLLAGPSGALNQAKLKKILMGYTRWNPEVGYCQGFNMLGAIILQVMEKNEVDSIKVMIFLIEGLLPNGYFCGSLMGLQVDMAVFRELLGNKLPKLARHLQKLQYSTNEPSVEPPLINVFTMQWFLTLFCNCIPMIAVLRIWDLIMIEGSDVLFRAALAIWKMLEDRILREVRTADDFYCKMETLSAELLDENKIDSNVLIQIISDLGAIKDLQKLRQKHLTSLYQDQKQLKMIYSKVQGESERLAVANAWQSNRTRRGSQPQREQSDREKIALDITILKKQYDKLKERQKQAHIILTSAVSKQNQQKHQQLPNVNKLLVGKHAIISKGRRGPPKGAIPPARKVVKSPKVHQTNSSGDKKDDNNTQSCKKPDEMTRRKNSLSWKEINAESPRKRSDSSSYSENSDTESSTSTSLCDDENNIPSLDSTPVKKKRHKDENNKSSSCAKSVPTATTLSEIKSCPEISLECVDEHIKEHRQVIEEEDETQSDSSRSHSRFHLDLSPDPEGISSISQLSPLPDISTYFTAISPIKTPCNYFEFPDFSNFTIGTSNENVNDKYAVNEQGVTNEFFERVTSSSVFNMLPSHVSYDMSYNHLPIQMRHSYPSDCGRELDLNETSRSSDVDEQQQQHKMSASHSPQSMSDIISKDIKCLKHVNQKSFSMEEPIGQESDVVKLNRSFSDGTIMECADLEKIIAENSKILIKLRALPDSMESLKMIEPILEEMTKSSSNSSECDEIAAIDIEEPSANEDGIFLSEINDIANIEQQLKSRNSNTCAYYDTTKPSATLPLVCNATTHDDDDVVVVSTTHSTSDDVTLQNEKSMNEDINSDALVTQQTCNNHNATTTDTSSLFAQKSLPLKDVNEKLSEEILSPKFNEISALVDKLKKEVMDSETIVTDNIIMDSMTSDNKDVSDNKNSNDVEQKSINVTVTISKDVDDSKEELDTKSHDLEKNPTDDSSAAVQKIDNKNSNSDLVLAKLNTQLEKCQTSATNDNKNNVEKVVDDVVNVKTAVTNGTTEHVVTKQETSVKVVMHQETAVKSTVKQETSEKVTVKNEVKQDVTEKDSNKIIEKLNKQLQRYEETTSKSPLGHRLTSVVSRSPSSERSNDYKRELEALIKERELEKSQKYRSDLSPSKSNHTLYDHEPRNEIRRRDIIASLETDQRIRRPFKSSPSSSLSSSPSNISSTLSSIQNTIKSLDSACQRSEIYNYKKLDKAMESIEKMCETDREWQYYKRIKTYESPPSFKIEDILTTKSPRNYLSDDILSDTTTFNRYETETKKVKTPELDPNYIAKLRCLSTEEYIAGRKSPLSLSPSRDTKLTTDRYSRIDRSPTSPILSSMRFLKSPTSDRASKSAENSPSRYGEESSTRSRYATSTSSTNLKGAESYNNLSYKGTSMTDKSRKYYDEFDWDKTSDSSISSNSINRRKYDI
ncbi:serine-rich adhesin for platelets [Chironomus tepperi]|uniref:serine-rich adhesin for platelets n=1 Tax=Chironomus tepperi TaxID=113505 RepID=UPI00391F4A5C